MLTVKDNYLDPDPFPSAWITRTKEKSRGRFKVYNTNDIYLEDSEEFEIELFNPTDSKVLAKISINGKSISTNGIVLKPGQRIFLERFIDTNNRFVHDVYETDDFNKMFNDANILDEKLILYKKELNLRTELLQYSDDKSDIIKDLKQKIEDLDSEIESLRSDANSIKNATKDNGKVSVSFTRELVMMYGNSLTYPNTYTYPYTYPYTYTYPNTTITGSCGYNNKMLYNSEEISTTMLFSNKTTTENDSSIETGRIDKGSKTDQTFITDNSYFEYIPFHQIEYILNPLSKKPLDTKDLRKYCSGCGKKTGKTDNYCSQCGIKI